MLKPNQSIIIITTNSTHSIAGYVHNYDDYRSLLVYEGFNVTHVLLIEDQMIIESNCNQSLLDVCLN